MFRSLLWRWQTVLAGNYDDEDLLGRVELAAFDEGYHGQYNIQKLFKLLHLSVLPEMVTCQPRTPAIAWPSLSINISVVT